MKKLFLTTIVAVALLTACKKDEDKPSGGNTTPPNEEEIITTLTLSFTDSANTSVAPKFTFKDPDGDGGKGPTQFDTIKLSANTTYYVTIELFNESKTPKDTISNEVLEEANDHMFFFKHTGVNITSTYLDKDGKNIPIGLSTKWRTGNTASGTSQIILKHQPGVKNGTQTPGETDIDVSFKSIIY